MIHFYFDENLPKQIPEALNVLDERNVIISIKEIKPGIKDIDILREISGKSAVFITADKNIRKKAIEREILLETDLIVFFFQRPLMLRTHQEQWETYYNIVKIWTRIVRKAKYTEKRPAFYKITNNWKIEEVNINN